MRGQAAIGAVRRPVVLALAAAAALLPMVASPAAEARDIASQLAQQAERIARLEAELATLRGLVSPGPRGSVIIGGPTSNRVELRARSNTIVVDRDMVTISGKRVTIDGITILIDGDSIRLDAPSITAKGGGETILKGSKVTGN